MSFASQSEPKQLQPEEQSAFRRDTTRSSLRSHVRFWALAAGSAIALAACGTTPTPTPGPGPVLPPPPPPPPQETEVQTREGVTPAFMTGRPIVRIGLLLPFSLRPQDAAGLYSAAELAMFDHGDQNTLLIPRDAGSTETESEAAARALLEDGADIIIGPVLRDGVAAAGHEARPENVPVIGFSSDRTVGGNGVYLLSFQLEDEISRIVSYAASQNLRTIALIAPSNEYGRRVEQALREEAARSGVYVPATEFYVRGETQARAAADRLAASLANNPAQAILIADNGGPLRSVAGELVRAGVSRDVKLLGTSAWTAGDVDREPTLAGGWYVASDPSVRQDFERRYTAAFSSEPTRLSSLAYDAVALAALLSRNGGANGFTDSALENSEGFLGSDGIFRFSHDGAIQRGLAIMEVRAGGSTVLDNAPRRFSSPVG